MVDSEEVKLLKQEIQARKAADAWGLNPNKLLLAIRQHDLRTELEISQQLTSLKQTGMLWEILG